MNFEDYDELLIRFDGDDEKEMSLGLSGKSNWTLLFRGEDSYDEYPFSTKEITLEELFNTCVNIDKMYKKAKKDAKSEMETMFKKRNAKLIENNKILNLGTKELLLRLKISEEENMQLKKTIKIVGVTQ